ncbi:MAG: sulfatase-like hydrolase/transferase [Bacteroidales bacterium]|nr:sulfatase-like hydrolase/transferase [Bacteroidales bacterium]
MTLGKQYYLILQALFLSLMMNSCGSAEGKLEGIRPNILLITSEDNGPHLGCYGDPFCLTPNLDQLASEGILFSRAYVTQAGCSQSRASIFTGLFPHQNGQIGLATHRLRMYQDDFPNMFSELKKAGYRTGVIGKIHVNPESAFPLDFHSKIKGGFSNRNVATIADTALNFFASGEEPFILMVNYKDAHRPFIRQAHGLPELPMEAEDVEVLPEIGIETQGIRQQLADYYNCLMRLDTGIGILLEGLEEAGMKENTLVIYLGDHGQDIIRGKRTSYEGGTRVPLIIYCPPELRPDHKGERAGGRVVEELVSTIDLFPTMLDITGIKAESELPGSSLMPIINGKAADWREYLFTEFHMHSGVNFYPQRTVRNSRYKLIHNLLHGENNPEYRFVLDKFHDRDEFTRALELSAEEVREAYRILHAPPEFELYDLENDPYEFHNLAGDPSAKHVLKELKEQLKQWQEQTNDPLLYRENLQKLKAEVDSCFVEGKYVKKKMWYYPDYFNKSPLSEL